MNFRTAVGIVLILGAVPMGAEAAKIVTGTIQSIDAVKNELKLSRTNEQGKPEQVAMKWKDDLPGVQALETAQVGSQVTVEANDSVGAWEVNRVIPQPAGQTSRN